ncbi:MAG: tripartite tricarboxylate transporter substrate binding protein [Burkholderiaceae bacterium]
MAAVGALALVGAPAAPAQEPFPSRPITILIPYPPGGSADMLARPLSQKLHEKFGQPVLLDYRAGAGGTIATQLLARAKPDGYTYIMVLAAHAINPSMYSKLPYDTRKDFAPVSLVATLPLVVVASPALPEVKTLARLVQAAKAEPGRITYASAGNGNTSHLAVELFDSMVGIKMTHVPYKGSSPAVTAMMGGEVGVMFDSLSTSLPQIRSGKLAPLAVTGPKRSAVLPDVPTVKETGVADFVVEGWYGMLAPAGTPPAIVERVSQAIAEAVKQPGVRDLLSGHGYEMVGSTPAAFGAHIDAELTRWAEVVKDSGATIQ